ncbi:MAG: hypothetical protein JRE23_07685 [Deltaproteobacteria bacterium]|nr:hypothetical protein [Deltaproteobacteria bacterium]MBW2646042.1 hypothetical protein [Deltaproteobacteria bacterium]
MKCLGLTKASNFRKRCTRKTSFLLCWQHAWQPFAAIVAIVVVLSAVAEFTGFSLRDMLSKTPLVPDITCTMEYPIKAEEDKVFRDKHNPDIIISNNGPVSALSVSGNVNVYKYNSQKDAITQYAYQVMKNFEHAFSKEELKPFEDLRHPTMGTTSENILAVYIIDVVFHIGTEMERFEREFRFFVEHKEISDEAQFKKDSRYAHIMQKLGDVDLSTWTGGLKFKATAAAEHTWFAEVENWYGARKGEDGKVTILGLPKGQGPSKQAGYPFLELKPHPFKATGLHIKAEIVDDHVEVKTAFAVTNTGDAAALVTEDGFEIVKTIEPGQTTYYTKTVNVGRMPGNEQPLENVIKSIDESEVAFEIQFSINYRPANDKEQFLKVTGHYNIGKHKVTEVAKVKKS